MRALHDIFRDEHGFTTTSMVLSLLVTLSLLFATAQVYRVNSAAAEVQDVADVWSAMARKHPERPAPITVKMELGRSAVLYLVK